MTVAATTNRKTYTGDNVTTSFATSPVIFYATSDLQVRVTVIATGVSTLLTLNTHYTVSGGSSAGAVGTVSLAGGSSPHGALLSTEKLVILRVLPLTQGVDLVNNNNSDAEVLEAALDKLTDVDQQIQEQADRSIRFASGDVSGSVTEIPDVTTRATRLLGFDAAGLLTTFVIQAGTYIVDLAAAAGSSLIGFIQAGTGAILRTLQAKARDTVSLADFAVDDGSDNTSAFQAAINKVQILGGELIIPPSSTRWLCNSGLTYDVTKGPLSIRGSGKWATVIRYAGTGTWLSATGGNAAIQLTLHHFTLQLNGAGGTGCDLSQAISSTVRSVRFASSTGAANGTGINSRPTNNAWAPFWNTLDDCTFDTLTSGIILDSTVGNAPNRWRIMAPTFLGGVSGIKIGNNSTQLVAGTDIIAPYFDQMTGAGITLGANADRTTIVAARQETSAGGSLFSINAAANRTTILGYQSHAGTLGTSALGTRGLMIGSWDDGLVRTTTTLGAPVANFLPGRTAPAYSTPIAIDASFGNEFDITATNGTAFTISNPINPFDGQRITITIRNTSGGALGALTWDTLYKNSAWTQPGNGFSRAIDFKYNGANWVQCSQTGVDVPN